jgi:hypothetical protein
MGNNNSPESWSAAPAPASIIVRSGEGVGGSDRVELIWGSDAVKGAWLQVTVRGNDELGEWDSNTGLSESDVFYFGSAPGDSGEGNATYFAVNSSDEVAVRNNPRSVFNRATINDRNDFNRDGLVNSADQVLVRIYSTGVNTALIELNLGGDGQTLAESPVLATAATVPATASGSPPSSTAFATAIAFSASPMLTTAEPLVLSPAAIRAVHVDTHFSEADREDLAMPPSTHNVGDDFWISSLSDDELIGTLAAAVTSSRQKGAVGSP